MKKRKKTINTVDMENGLTLCCLCGEHNEDSTCEVYLRQTGAWDVKKKEQEFLEEINEWLKKNGENNKTPAPYIPYYPPTMPQYPTWPSYPPSGYICQQCGQYVYANGWHDCRPRQIWYGGGA